jgi:NAD(P)-dependent dehydrogenase (short-subunit alcohol dehydrogenase family)
MADGAFLNQLYSLDGQVAVVTGGAGLLGSALARGLAAAGAHVVILGRRLAPAQCLAAAIGAMGGRAQAVAADVCDEGQLAIVRDQLLAEHGRIDILVNAAGGNLPEATVAAPQSALTIPIDATRRVLDLNLLGTLAPIQVFGAAMARRAYGCIVNISSVAADRPLSRVGAYAASKAAVESLTRWLAVELAATYGPGMRVNAIAPGFFISEKNRALLLHEDGTPSERGARVLQRCPLGRFGEPDELVGALLWLCGAGAKYVTGAVIPVDGGFLAGSGV